MDVAAYFIDPCLICVRTPVWPRPHYAKEFEDGGCPLKTHQMFSVHTTPEEFKNTTITDHFGFVFEENSVRESHHQRDAMIFEKLRLQNICFPSTRK